MKRMLINATQAEELRVAVVDGQKLLELEIEFSLRPEKKGNIYKARVTRVEPSLDAVFVDYGETNSGFLPFKEIARQYFKEGVDPHKARVSDAIVEGQEFLVQVEKDERGTKGAAVSTFISLAGRYIVLMPANPRAGGVSRRADANSRNEMRDAMDQLTVPDGMGLIIRTAGVGRDIQDLNWDLDYLKQLWKAIVEASTSLTSPGLIYQESNLVIRAIRDYFQPDIHEILIDTKDVYEQASQFMSYVMPSYADRVKLYTDNTPLFSRFQVEHQIETAYSRTVTLPSGGSIVIDRTEALVAIDINSSRSTRGRDVEQTAFTTNLEAAEEIARQLRLRDLGGLIVIDFIDMESNAHQRDVENCMKEALRYDRARIQMQRLSKFGLLEISRQRLHPALGESSNVVCPRCAGAGSIRSTDSFALQALREIEEEALKENSGEIRIQVPVEVASFLLNEKRTDIQRIELRSGVNVMVVPNRYLETPHYKIERLRHDELNELGESKTSYQLAEEMKPTEVDDNRLNKQTSKQQVPVVKGIMPQQPAPTTPIAKPPVPSSGWWAKILSLFSTIPQETLPPTPTPTSRPPRQDRTDRNARGGRDRPPRGDRPDRPTRPTDRPDRVDRPEKNDRDRSDNPRAREGQPRDASRQKNSRDEQRATREAYLAGTSNGNEASATPAREPREPRPRRDAVSREPREMKPQTSSTTQTTPPTNDGSVGDQSDRQDRPQKGRSIRARQFGQGDREGRDRQQRSPSPSAPTEMLSVKSPETNPPSSPIPPITPTIPQELVKSSTTFIPPPPSTPMPTAPAPIEIAVAPVSVKKPAEPLVINLPAHLKMVETVSTMTSAPKMSAPPLGRQVVEVAAANVNAPLQQVEMQNH